MSLENILSSAKKTLRNSAITGLTGLSLLGATTFYSPQIKAEDIKETKTISLITSSDSDGDGLTNDYELSIGSNPNLFDTDGDKLGDGEEIGYNNNPNDPLNFDSPGFGSANTIRRMKSIQNLTSGLDNVVASTWLVGGKIAYIEDGSLYVKNLFDLSEPRKLLVSGLDNQFREIASGPKGDSVYFHKNIKGKDIIQKVDIKTEEISNVVPSNLGNVSYGIRNPSISGNLGINKEKVELFVENNHWLVAETNLPDVTKGQIYLYKLVSNENDKNFGVWDGSKPFKLTDCLNKVMRPKISKDGDMLMFQEVINGGSSSLLLFNGVKGIVNNKKKPYNSALISIDLRGDTIVFPNEGVIFPGGFGREFAYWVKDKNNFYSLNRNNLNEADFDIFTAPYGVGSTGRFEITETKKSIILPNNQLGISISPEGGRIAYLDNYLEESEGNYNLYGAATKGSFKIVEGLEAEYLNGYKDSSGISLEGNYPEHELMGGKTLFSISMLFNPISDASGSEYFSGLREFEPSGLEVIGPGPTTKSYHPAGVYMKLPWDNTELVTSEGILDETSISVAWEEVTGPSTTEFVNLPENQIIERNLDQNYIIFYTDHFSSGGFKARLLEKVSDVVNWRLMDKEGKEESYGVIVGSPTSDYKPYVLELKPWKP